MPRVAELKDQVDRIWCASFHTDLADTLTQQLRQHALVGVQAALEAALREEVADYRDRLRTAARAAGRTPSRFRCAGQYHRRVLTTYGLIPDLRVPKLRSGNAERPWEIHPLPTGHAGGAGSGSVSVYARPLDPRPPRGPVSGLWPRLVARGGR